MNKMDEFYTSLRRRGYHKILILFIAILGFWINASIAETPTPSLQSATSSIFFASPNGAIRATIDEFAWMEGTWKSETSDGQVEQIWSEPLGGIMTGTFRIYNATETFMVEYLTLRESTGSIELNLRHFSPVSDIREAKTPLLFWLTYQIAGYRSVFQNKNQPQFNRIDLLRTGEDRYSFKSQINDKENPSIVEVNFTRHDTLPLDENWICIVDSYGMGSGVRKLREAHPLSYYQEHILPLDEELNDVKHSYDKLVTKKIRKVGSLHNREIYEILLQIDGADCYDEIQLLLLQRVNDLYAPIFYLLQNQRDQKLIPPWIQNDSVIARRIENSQMRTVNDTKIRITPDGPETPPESMYEDYDKW